MRGDESLLNKAFQLKFYETKDGKQPAVDFIDNLPPKMAAKLIGLLEILEEKGTELRMPYSRLLEDGIFELRCNLGTNSTRILYFFYYNGTIVVTNGFVKKTQKTPKSELRIAKERRDDWISRQIHSER